MLLKGLLVVYLAVCVHGEDKTKCAGKFDKEGTAYAIGEEWTETLNNVNAACACRKERDLMWVDCSEDWCDDAARFCTWNGCYNSNDGNAYPVGATVRFGDRDCRCKENDGFIADAPEILYAFKC